MTDSYDAIMLASLREEIAFFNLQQFVLVLFVSTLTVTLFVLAHWDRFSAVSKLIPVAIASGLVAIGRADLLMHRAGAYIWATEANGQSAGWETFKNSLLLTRLLPLYDLFALSLWIYLFVWAERKVWQTSHGRMRRIYLAGTVLLAVLGIISIIIGATRTR